jgi:hypothetical protein
MLTKQRQYILYKCTQTDCRGAPDRVTEPKPHCEPGLVITPTGCYARGLLVFLNESFGFIILSRYDCLHALFRVQRSAYDEKESTKSPLYGSPQLARGGTLVFSHFAFVFSHFASVFTYSAFISITSLSVSCCSVTSAPPSRPKIRGSVSSYSIIIS